MAELSSDLSLALRIRALVEGQDAIVGLGTSFVELNQRIENLIRGLTAISGSTDGAAQEFEYLAGVSEKYGLKILDLSDNYVKLIASSKGTALEGEAVKKVFDSVSGAMAVLGGDTTTVHRAFNALAQMMSKGQIYSEELKGQLAEAIPGALGIMSRALGITTADLLALMEAGSLSSDVLLPFATQLEQEFGKFATTGKTFTQAVNDLKNAWTLLMKRFADGTGAFKALTDGIEFLSKSSGILAGAIGVGLAVAFSKLTASIASTITSVKNFIPLLGVQANATQRAAAANLEAAVAANASAQAEAAAARQSVVSLSVQRAGTLTAEARIRVEAALRVALASRTIAERQAAAAAIQLANAEKAIIASTTGFSRVLNFLAGPAGLILTAIASFGAMAYAFREQDDVTKNLTKSTEDYAKSLENMTERAIVASIKKLEVDRKATEKAIENAKNEVKIRQEAANANIAWKASSEVVEKSQEKLRDAVIKLDEEEQKLVDTDIKLRDSRSALTAKSSSLIVENEKLKSSYSDLKVSLKEQENAIASLYKEKQKGKNVDDEIQKSQKKISDLHKEEFIITRKLRENQEQQNIAMSDYVASQKKLAPAISATSGVIAEQKLTTEELEAKFKLLVQTQLASVNRQNALKNAIVELKGEQEALSISLQAQVNLLERQANAIGDVTAARAANIAKAEAERESAKQSLGIANLELETLREERREKLLLLESNPKIAKQTQEQIAKLDALISKQQAEVEARRNNVIATREEAEAANVAGETISQSISRQRDEAAKTSAELAKLRQTYADMVAAGEDMDKLRLVMDAIAAAEKRVADQANDTVIATNAAFKSLGLSFEEVMTGMDFETRKQIDALRTLGLQGKLTGDDLRKAMDQAISTVNSRDEINELKVTLKELAYAGKISTDEYKQAITSLNVKLADLAAAVDPASKALEKLGLGVPERLNALSKEMKANAEIVRDRTKSVVLGQDAFLKAAEVELNAAKASDRLANSQFKSGAAALGLSNAYDELARNLARANPEFDAIAAKMDRIAEVSRLRQDAVRGEVEVDLEHIETLTDKSAILGEGLELSRELVEQSKAAIELARQEAESDRDALESLENKVAALERERAERGKLSPIQERELELLKLEIPLKRQSADISRERAKQAEQEAFSQGKVIEQIERVIAASERETDANVDVLRAKLESIETEKGLAVVKGDAATASEKQAQADRVSLEIERQLIEGKENASEAARRYLQDLTDLAEQDGIVNEVERQGIEIARQKVEITEEEEIALRKSIEAQREKAKADLEQAEAAAKIEERAKQIAAQGEIVSGAINGWIERLKALSPAAVEAFEKMRGFTRSTVEQSSSADRLDEAMAALGDTMRSLGDTGFAEFLNRMAFSAQRVEVAFLDQAQSAEQLAESLNAMADSGSGNMETMIRSAESAMATFDLLDKTRLDSLQSAIDRARGAMDSLRESSEAALEAAQRALAQQQGDQRAILELDRKRKIAELDQQIEAARAANDQESLSRLQQALELEERTYDLKKKALDEERSRLKETAGQTGSGDAPKPSGGATNTTINNTFLIDPTKLANEEWVKRNVMPTIEKVGRLRA